MISLIKEFLLPFNSSLRMTFHRWKIKKKNPTCVFYENSWVDQTSQLGAYNVVFKNASISNSIIGDYTFIQKASVVNNADIGKFCSIASGVCIGLGSHPVSFVSSHPAFYASDQPIPKTFCEKTVYSPLKRTIVGHDVWIGQNALIKDGIKIGTGSIIGAGAVVTHDVPEYAIVAGVPAEIIRYRFDAGLRSKLVETKWWDLPEKKLKDYCEYFKNPEIYFAKSSNSR
jgi:acetyltransferase-like isoleucine patch superfamily enzyme